MKYFFFFNGQPLLLCCVCCKIAIQDFLTGLYKKNKKNLRFHRRVYWRTIIRRYFTESCKTITGLCHNHRRIITRWYFTESCKKITGLCHNHRRVYRRTITRRYFTESCKKITGLCHNHRRVYRLSYRRPIPTKSPTALRTSWSARMCDTCPSAQIPTDFLTSNTDGITDGFTHIPKRTHVWHVSVCMNTDGSKSLAGFSNFFLVRISINFRWNYRRNLMPPTTINFRR